MIVPMKKATILCETGDAEATVKYLRALGVLHVEHQNLPEGSDISGLQGKLGIINSSFGVLNQVIVSEKNIPPQNTISGDWVPVADHIIDLGKRHEQLESSSGNVSAQIKEWERWGDVDLNQIHHLNQNGIYLRLYQVPLKDLGRFPDGVVVKTIFIEGDIAHCVAISRRQFDCGFKEMLPPQQTLSALTLRLAENARVMETIKGEIIECARFYEDLSGIKKKLEKEIELQQVVHGMGREGAFRYVTGYIPSDMEGRMVAEARSRRWGILITEPSVVDDVPTLIRNPEWVNMIKPVLGFLGLTPGYHELDVSMPFLIFFSIFFGILIGDAGYGLVYILITLLITIWLQKKMKLNTETKRFISLFYLLGFCAVIWGILACDFFGQAWLLNLGYKPLVPQLTNATFMQTFCFFLGALQLTIAHSWRASLKFPSLKALADIGYICILWTAFLLANTLVLGETFPPWGIWLVVTGVVLVILFTNPQAHVLRGIGEGLGTMALSFMNNITDVISYIRLFAVGLATLAIAETTNTLAAEASAFGSGVIAVVAGLVILIFGHGLNLMLGLMSVLVHGVRLNVLEFSGHANVAWSGVAFKPFNE
jgi:V/A-type H+-transporting ATPase subunit I